MSVEAPPVATPVKSYTPPVSQVVYSYPPPSADAQGIKPTAPPYYPQQQQQQPSYTYAQMPYQQTWVNPTYQPQLYPPQQYQQQRFVVAAPPVQQQPQQGGSGMAIAGGFLAGMLAADILDDITDP
jgi:hypothetical protein